MSALVFVDTNIFIYAFDEAAGAKQVTAMHWLAELWQSRRGRVSFQVLQEYYFNVAKKWPEAREQARDKVRELLGWRPVPINHELIERGWTIQDRYRLSFWDALIVAAAGSALCQYLLTEDLQADQNLDGVTVVNPFLVAPGDLLQS